MVNEIEIERLPYTNYQEEIINSKARFTITEASTKCGKTISHLSWLFEQSQLDNVMPGWEYWWVAPIYSQAEIAFKRLYHIVAESGIYNINLSKLSITTPRGTIITFKSADHPDSLYGENVHAFVFDEFSRAKEDAWFALRTTVSYTQAPGKFIGNVIARNWAWELARRAEKGEDSDFEYFRINAYQAIRAGILSKHEIDQAKKDLPMRIFKMLYMAEYAEIEGALWTWDLIDKNRVNDYPNLVRLAIAIDPAVTSTKESDETGIIIGGKSADENYYILKDLSGIYSPQIWAKKAISAYNEWKADRIVAEVNNGGDLVETIIRNIDNNISYSKVNASRGKIRRAEPIEALYEQNRVHHVGRFTELEEQMTTYRGDSGDPSPDRMDALVWLITFLMKKTIDTNVWH